MRSCRSSANIAISTDPRAMTQPNESLPAHAYGAWTYPRFIPVGDAALTVEFGE